MLFLADTHYQSPDENCKDTAETLQNEAALPEEHTISQLPHKDKAPFSTYVKNESPVKKSKKGYAYFNFKLQNQSCTIDGVLSDNSMQNILSKTEETQKAVRLSNYGLKRQLDEQNPDAVVVNKRTKIDYINNCNLDFQKIAEKKTMKMAGYTLYQNIPVTVTGEISNKFSNNSNKKHSTIIIYKTRNR